MANYNLTQTDAEVQVILDRVAAGYIYMGTADLTTTPDTTNPNVCYLLKAIGTYTNFGNIQHASGIGIALWNGTAWSYQNVPSSAVVQTDATPTENSTNPVQSGGVYDAINSLTDATNETIYESEGQVKYYQANGAYFGWRGIATYTPQLSEESEINRIYFPPFKGQLAQAKDMLYYIGYGDFSGLLVPNNLTKIVEGTIQNVSDTAITDYVVELDDSVTIPAGNRVFICLYGLDTQKIQLLGGGSAVTTLQPYSSDDAIVFLLSTDTTTPFSQNWSRASAGTTARYMACNPILRLYKSAIIPTIVDERLNELLPEQVEDIIVEKSEVKLYLPNKLYAVVGDTLQIFFQAIVADIDLSKYDIYVNCPKGQTFIRYYSYTPSSTDVGTTTFTIYVKDRNNNILGQASCDLVTIASPSSPSSRKAIFTFGDSLTSGGQWVGEAKRRLVGTSTYDGIAGKGLTNLAFYGYLNTEINEQSVDYFGVGGWTWGSYLIKGTGGAFRFYVSNVTSLSIGAIYTNNGHSYTIQEINVTGDSGNIRCTTSSNTNIPSTSGTLTKTSGNGDATITFASFETENANPLWDDTNNKMSFIPYVQDCGATTIDAVYVLLTWNGQEAWKEYSAEDETGHIANAKTFARTLHSEYPSAKLFIMGIQMPSDTGGLGKSYGASGGYVDSYGVKQCALNYNKALQDLCNLDEFSSYCEFVPVAPQFDSHYNMPYNNTNVNTRNTTKEMRGSNGVHPSDAGYFQIADAVYRSIVANFCQ